MHRIDYGTACPICSLSLERDNEIVAIESGEMVYSEKKQRVTFQRDRSKKVLARAHLHLTCLLLKLDLLDNPHPLLGGCMNCALVEPPRWVFRCRIGNLDTNTWMFMPLHNDQNQGLLCVDCTQWLFGGNHVHEQADRGRHEADRVPRRSERDSDQQDRSLREDGGRPGVHEESRDGPQGVRSRRGPDRRLRRRPSKPTTTARAVSGSGG